MAAAVVLAAALVLGALGTTGSASAAADPPAPSFLLRPGTNQVYVLDAAPGDDLELLDAEHAVVETGTVDAQGSLAWRQLSVGPYTVRVAGQPDTESDPVTVTGFRSPAPPQSFYDEQTIEEGFHYITTRDGTTLSANVSLPSGDGPFPTVVEYSGYGPSNPGDTTFAQLFNTLGFAYVGVNIRGTGCSGGSFLNFEPVQSLDGYDAVEAIAAQPWVKFHRVGMVGISYPGISQLYVARTQPPHLAAITPLSVIDDTFRGTLYPGGVLNTGFAVPWAAERATQSAPYGQAWTKTRADNGDTECADNQLLRLQNPDPLQLIEDNPFYDPVVADQVNPSLFVKKINVPVFLSGAWQDEQTGGHFPALLDDFTGSPHVYASMANGSHTESLGLGVFSRYADFLDLYVGRRVPGTIKNFVAPVLAKSITGIDGLQLPPGIDYTDLSYQQARKKFESQDPVRIGFEEGAAAGQPSGSPIPRFVRTFSAWPVPSAKPTAWYLTPGGGLRRTPPTVKASDAARRSYVADPTALPATNYTGNGNAIWGAHPTYDWQQIPDGTGLGWISPPLAKNVVAVGTGSVDLWVKSSVADTDLEVTLSEVRPDGTDIYVQSGWLRASHRKLDRTASTPISPVHTDLEADAAPLPAGKFTRLRVELFPFAQAFRKGSQLRITVDAPGGARPLWAFDTIADGEQVTIAADRRHHSRVVLAVVPGVKVPAKAPLCSSLRSQPCRTYP